jgi:hypothetical protein
VEWGTVKFDLRDEDISFHVVRKSNPIAARQVDAARQVLLEAAFGIPVRASKKELADVLGAGYPLADIGAIGPATSLDDARASILAKCPGALEEDRGMGYASWTIPVDHPLLTSVRLHWSDKSVSAWLDGNQALADCLGTELRALEVGTDAFARTLDTVAACHNLCPAP